MSLGKLFTPSTIYQTITVTIDGFDLAPDDMLNFKLDQRYDTFGLYGTLQIMDTYDVKNNGLAKFNILSKVVVSITDFSGTTSKRTFRILSEQSELINETHKTIKFALIDEITYILSTSYISKGFNDTAVNAFMSYLTELKVTDVIKADKLLLDTVDTSISQTFIVPQNQSVLEFFEYQLNKENIRMYQTRNAVHIKEILPNNIPLSTTMNGDDVIYSNDVPEHDYLYKIHDIKLTNNNFFNNSNSPSSEIFRYDGNKVISSKTNNLNDVITNLTLNKPLSTSDFQDYRGYKLDKQEVFTTNNQKFDLFETYMTLNKLEIVCAGDLSCELFSVVQVRLKGNVIFIESSNNGDTLSSGKYLIVGINESIIKDKMIQKISLIRLG